jgi:OOP family OmpA-OmpF porin
MNKICWLPHTLLLLIFLAFLAFPLSVTAEMVKKVDNFIVFIDQSGSMAWAKAEPGNQKIEQAVDAIKRFDKATPELGYNGGVSTFAPYGTVSSPTVYKTGALGSAADSISPPFNWFTPMGDGFADIDSDLAKLSGKTALILYTDGESNEGMDPVQEAKGLYGKYSNNLCLHVVSYADSPQGEQIIKDIAALSACSVVADAKSLNSDDAMARFAKAILYEDKPPAPAPKAAPAPAPAPAPVVVAKEVITFNLLFDFDKAEIKDEMIPSLEQVKMIIDEDPKTNFVLSGHTDSTGAEDYNQGLSERRAAAVKGWLVDHGVPAARLQTVGYGEGRAKYDNATREGRKLNRRVEMQSQ